MARKEQLLQLPVKAGEDIKTIGGILSHWSGELEGLGKEVFTWVKGHKFLVILLVGIAAFCKYFLAETESKRNVEEDY